MREQLARVLAPLQSQASRDDEWAVDVISGHSYNRELLECYYVCNPSERDYLWIFQNI